MTQRVNIQQAESQTNKALQNARKKGYRFWNLLQRRSSLVDIRDGVINKLGGSTSAFWWGFSFIALAAAVGFGIFAAFTYRTMLVGLFGGSENIPQSIFTILGVSFSVVNIIFGHLIKEGFETNSITGKSSGNIWETFLGVAGVIMMGIFLYLLTSTAGQITGEESHLPFVIIFTVLIEAALGAILIKPCRYAKLLFIQIALWVNSKLLGYNSRKCDQYYEDYRRYAEAYNQEESAGNELDIVERDSEHNIRLAVMYFRGVEAGDEENNNYVNSLDELENDDEPTSANGESVETQIDIESQNGSTNGQDTFNEDDFRI